MFGGISAESFVRAIRDWMRGPLPPLPEPGPGDNERIDSAAGPGLEGPGLESPGLESPGHDRPGLDASPHTHAHYYLMDVPWTLDMGGAGYGLAALFNGGRRDERAQLQDRPD
ncbi:MAG: hypothetical protein AAGA91_13050 [Pseudomonadota bacterium]